MTITEDLPLLKPLKGLNLNHTRGEGSLPLNSIKIPFRLRDDTAETRAYISTKLTPSIAEQALAQPIGVQFIEGVPHLIFGWCRLQAFRELKHETIPYVTRENMSEDDRLSLELEENIIRRDMTWQEICLSVQRVHELKIKTASKDQRRWGIRQTGHLLGVSSGYVQQAKIIAEEIQRKNCYVLEAPNITAAINKLRALKQDQAAAELARRHNVITQTTPALKPQKVAKQSGPAPSPEHPSPIQTPQRCSLNEHAKQERVVDLSWLMKGDCLEWFKTAEPESVDLVYTDIPYAIDMNDVEDHVNSERVKDEHNVEENLAQMPRFIEGAYKVLKPDTFLLFWMDLCCWELLKTLGEKAGFTVQPWPIVWHKTHTCKNKSAGTWWTKNIEYVMVMRKGQATLRNPQASCLKASDGAPERKMQANPFAKPFEFSKWLLDPIIYPGMKVLDCYAGEGSIVRALLNLGCQPIAIEKKDIHFNRLLQHVKEYYIGTTHGGVKFV